jgi:pantoate kinase
VTRRGALRARAFAPAHVTGIFRPSAEARDPRARGSLGAGVVLELGVHATATFAPGRGRRVRVSSDAPGPLPISEDVARRLFPPGNGTLDVRLVHDLPIGQGFGLSAAGATATALAVAAVGDRSRSAAVATAHLADLFGGGGLGGVAAIATGGGIEFRRRAGLPPWGDVVHRPWGGTVFLGVVGRPIPTSRVLRSRPALARIDRASAGLETLFHHPSADRFFAECERFTDRAGLAPAAVRSVLRELRARGAYAAQAMFGRAFFAHAPTARSRASVIEWLGSRELSAVEVRAARSGAHVVSAAGLFKQPF